MMSMKIEWLSVGNVFIILNQVDNAKDVFVL
jgi:hypothetical protein